MLRDRRVWRHYVDPRPRSPSAIHPVVPSCVNIRICVLVIHHSSTLSVRGGSVLRSKRFRSYNHIVYGWYVTSTAGFRTPNWFKHLISLIQVTQMFFGCWIIHIANHNNVWRNEDSIVYWMATGMYGSYVFLFSHMLVKNVCGGGNG